MPTSKRRILLMEEDQVIIRKEIAGVEIYADDNGHTNQYVVHRMTDWGKWPELLAAKQGLYIIDYGTPSNYGHITLGLDKSGSITVG